MASISTSAIGYAPGMVPQPPSDAKDVIRWAQEMTRHVREEEAKIAGCIRALAQGHLETSYVVPDKPRAGDIRFADGTSWNPGFGEGIYRYTASGAWALVGRPPVLTVATLPAAASHAGAIAYVTDANATTRLSTVAAGGANKVLVYSDATNWLIA